ncbi:hypothetical protein ACJ2A9_21155 [Anaerobacillus sp. MEB173]|uniref:hypothetical protein n=1 Tax=Anaerobacillus sp. MEB173 TaxID=3383345 RepID=UPI003F8E0172
MSKNKIIKSVGFIVTNPDDEKILKAIKRRKNFSGYVKKLILDDIERKNYQETNIEESDVAVNEKPVEKKLSVAERLEQHKKRPSKNTKPHVFIPNQPKR